MVCRFHIFGPSRSVAPTDIDSICCVHQINLNHCERVTGLGLAELVRNVRPNVAELSANCTSVSFIPDVVDDKAFATTERCPMLPTGATYKMLCLFSNRSFTK